MEWLGDIEAQSVAGSVLIGVLVLLGFPALAVPKLPVAFIARSIRVRSLGDDQLGTVFEGAGRVSASEVRSVMHLWAQVTCSGRSCEVVDRLVVGSSGHHGACTVTARSGMKRSVSTGDLTCVESSGGVVVLWLIDDFWLENLPSLLGDSLAQKTVFDLDAGNVTGVAWNDGSLSLFWTLGLHVVVRSPVEVVGGPSKEFLLLELFGGTVVREAELRVLINHAHF